MNKFNLRPSRDIHRQVKEIVAEQVGVPAERINDSDQLEADLGADSLTIVEIVMELEEEFDIHFPEDIEDPNVTVGRLTEGVITLLPDANFA